MRRHRAAEAHALGFEPLEVGNAVAAEALQREITDDALDLVAQVLGHRLGRVGEARLALLPGAAAATRELSTALDSGKHTTTHARRYRLPDAACPGATLIDSPGLQEFGLKHLTPAEIEFGFPEFRPFLGQCRFRDCQHDAEPGCAIKQALAEGMIHSRRLDHFHQFISENRHGSH